MNPSSVQKAIFAGGCFWCMEPPFRALTGVTEVVCGYVGGHKKNPTYEEVCSGTTGHLEAVEVTFDPEKVTFAYLIEEFWKQIDPTDDGGAFCDRGTQYQSAIFCQEDAQIKIAEASKETLDKSGKFDKPIATKILIAPVFYPAEDYHQSYYKKETARYKAYRGASGRDEFIQEIWCCPLKKTASESENTLRKKLTPVQYHVTQENGTEPAFSGAYWDEHREGLYVDIVSGEVLFTSRDKFDSECGWPSFSKPVDETVLKEKTDESHGMKRTEVRSQKADSHLGHVFDDGPGPTGLRYCINSASLKFIPVEELETQGYGNYMKDFKK